METNQLKQVFDYQGYLDFMESKKVRHGNDRTFTLLDFVTDEQKAIDKENGVFDLSIYDPTPLEIKEHFEFIEKTLNELKIKLPNDEYLKSLSNEESMQEIYASYDWYSLYDVKK